MIKKIIKYLASATIWRFEPKIIAVTGSVGKTSSVEAICAVLKHPNSKTAKQKIRASRKELESDLRVSLAILRDFNEEETRILTVENPSATESLSRKFLWLKIIGGSIFRIFMAKQSDYPSILVLEYGLRRVGDIKHFLDIARVEVGVITALGEIPSHLEFFSGPEEVFREKSHLIEHLSSSGYAILNFDDENVIRMKDRTRGRIVSFGFQDGADVRITNLENVSENERPMGIVFKINYGGSAVPVVIKGVFGKVHAYAAAVAVCVGLIFDLNLTQISDALRDNYRPFPGRMALIKGIKETFVIDDSSGASSQSVHEALHTLNELPAKRKIAVLGDILELGKYSLEAHEYIGRLAGKMIDVLVTVGPRGKFIAGGARAAGMYGNKILSYDSVAEAGKALQDLLRKGDLVLVKGSKEIGLEKAVEEIREV